MIINEPISPESKQQFVTQVGHLTPAQVGQVKACLRDQSPEFMEGLLAGLAAAHQIFTLPDGDALLKVVVAVIAGEMAYPQH